MRYTGEVRLFAGNYTPDGWMVCLGQTLPIAGNHVLFTRIGTSFGGDGVTNFNLPNATKSIAVDPGNGFSFPAAGTASGPVATPTLPIMTIISLGDEVQAPLAGEVKTFAFPYPPSGWLPCVGTSLPIAGYPDLFGIIGTTYGGDGVVNFSLPDLRGTTSAGFGPQAEAAAASLAIGFLVMNFCIATGVVDDAASRDAAGDAAGDTAAQPVDRE